MLKEKKRCLKYLLFIIHEKLRISLDSSLREAVISYPGDLLKCYFYRSGQHLIIQTFQLFLWYEKVMKAES